MSELDYSAYCNKRLFEEIKELNHLGEEYKKEIEHIKKVYSEHEGISHSAHSFYEGVFCRYILELINKKYLTEVEQEIIDRSFRFVEELANHEDYYVRNVIEVSFIEPLLAYIQPTKRIEDYVLPKSLEMAKDIGSFRFGFDPNTWEKRRRM